MTTQAFEVVVTHEVGHAACQLFLALGVRRIVIAPRNSAQFQASSRPRVPADDIGTLDLVTCLLAGFRAETDDLDAIPTTATDIKEARRVARERLGAASDTDPEVETLLREAWNRAGEILSVTKRFRSAAEGRVCADGDVSAKTSFQVEDLWIDPSIGYRVVIHQNGESRSRVAELLFGGTRVGTLTYAVEPGSAGSCRVVLTQMEIDAAHRRFGNGRRLLRAVEAAHEGCHLIDSPLENTADGESFLAAIRRRRTIHHFDCHRADAFCLCDA